MFWNFERPEKWRRTFHILDDERLNVDDKVIDVGNGDVIDVSNGDIFAIITVPPNSHFLPISDPAPSSLEGHKPLLPTDPCYAYTIDIDRYDTYIFVFCGVKIM